MRSTEKSFVQQRAMRVANRYSVLEAIADGMRTRRQIQNTAGLSWGTVSSCVSQLAAENVIAVEPDLPEKTFTALPASGGRSSYCFFSRSHNLLAGISVSGNMLDLKVVTPDRTLITAYNMPIGMLSDIYALKDAVSELFGRSGISADKISFTVIALTGAFERINKIWIKTPHLPQVNNWDLSQLSDVLPGTVCFEHDIISKARSVMMNRQDFGKDFAFLHWGNGVGLTICRDGIFQEGHRGFALEIGHIPYPGNGSGTLETIAALPAVQAFAGNRGLPLNSPEVWDFLEPHILWALTAVSGLFDPAIIVLGGELTDVFAEYITDLSEKLEKLSWIPMHNQLKFYNMQECDTAMGAAFSARSALLDHIADTI